MKTLAEIFYDAIMADSDVLDAISFITPTGNEDYAIKSTCFEVPPGELDNTPLPNIIISDDGFVNSHSTKDVVWESDEDVVQATVDIAACSPDEVSVLVAKVRKAIENHICSMYASGQDTPQLQEGFPTSQGIEWDWAKPCYFQKIVYQCVTTKFEDDDKENN